MMGSSTHLLTHPRYEHTKTYYVLVERLPDIAALEQLRKGVDLPTGRTAPAQVQVANRLPRNCSSARDRTKESGSKLCCVKAKSAKFAI